LIPPSEFASLSVAVVAVIMCGQLVTVIEVVSMVSSVIHGVGVEP